MALEWIEEQADKAIKSAVEAGTALTHEVQSLEHKMLRSSTSLDTSSNTNDSKGGEQQKSQAEKNTSQKKEAAIGTASLAASSLAASSLAASSLAAIDLAASSLKASDMKTSSIASNSEKKIGLAGTIYIPKISELSTDNETLQAAALKAELKSKQLPAAVGSLLGYLANPIGSAISAGIALGSELVKVAENVYQTGDKSLTLTVNKVAGRAAEELKAEYNKLFEEKPTPASMPGSQANSGAAIEFNNIFDKVKEEDRSVRRVSCVDDKDSLPKEMMHWLFDANEKPQNVAVSENLFSFKNDKQEQTNISTEPGHVHIEKKDSDGNLKTLVDKTDGKTVVLHGNESVVIENGKEIVKGPGYKVSWDEQGKRHITLDNGSEVVRDGDKVKLIDKSGGAIHVEPHLLSVPDSNISFIDSMDKLAQLTKDKLATLHPGEAALIAIKDAGTRTIFADGTIFDVQNDHARLETPDHKVIQFEMKDNQIFIRHEGKLIPIDSKENSLIKAENGKFKIGGLAIDPHTLCIEADTAPAADKNRLLPHYRLDLISNIQRLIDQQGHQLIAVVAPDNSTTVQDSTLNKIFNNNHQDSTVTITTPLPNPAISDLLDGAKPQTQPQVQPETIKIDLVTTNLDLSNKVIDEPDKTTIKDTNTVIDKDHTVHIGGEDGPTVHPDGSVRVDKDTFVDKDMTVHAKDWTSPEAKKSGSNSESNAQSAAQNVSSKANSISNRAKGGVVRWSEIAQLNCALGDVLNLMGSVPADTQAYAMLLNSYGILVETINDATPKAVVTENAIEHGINSPNAIKAMENGASQDEVTKKRFAA